MHRKVFSLGVSVRLNSENRLFEQAAVSFSVAPHSRIQTQPRFRGEKPPKHSCYFISENMQSLLLNRGKRRPAGSESHSGGVSYLGGHDAEAHAIVLLQSYRDNLWLLPHWLKRERDRKTNLTEDGTMVLLYAASEILQLFGVWHIPFNTF